jgi:putative ATP-binding cassette transporter
MKLFRLFTDAAPNRVFFAILMGAVAGISYSALIPLVMASIAPLEPGFVETQDALNSFLSFEVQNYEMAKVYLISCIFILLTRSASEIILLHVGATVAKKIRTNFYQRIMNAPLSTIERVGDAKLIASVNIDVSRVVIGARLIPAVFVNLITLVGMLGFLMYLNSQIFKIVITSITVGIVIYQLPMMFGRKIFEKNRETNDDLQYAFKGLIFGLKELKLDSKKRDIYLNNVLAKYETELVRSECQGHTVTRSTVSLGDLLSFFVIGFITFIFVNYHEIGRQELAGTIMALLYITTPIAIVLNAIPGLTIASVSYRKVNRILESIPREEISESVHSVPQWQSLDFKDVSYAYEDQSNELGFRVGPINLSIEKGSVTFIIGGNGSGKSTLSKLITQHYLPSSGQISIDNHVIDSNLVNSFRDQIYAIYSNYHLFDELLIDINEQTSELLNHYLKEFKLDKKITVDNGRFSTTQLSDGQRKRLAMVVGLLDKKELYLFDEWAADQDPEFKYIFYTDILKRLKAQGKAVVVISHDDQYFSVADKILKMDNGRLFQLATKDHQLSINQMLTINKNDQPEVEVLND